MADDVMLRECPFCGAPAEVYAPYKIIRCSNPDCLMEVRTMVNLREERRADVWNARVSDPALAVKDALHEAVVVALDHLTAGLGKREDVILELREAHLRAADVDHANRSLSPKEIRIKELEADLAAIKGRTCATCKHVDHWTTSEDIDRYACAHNPRSTVAVTGEHFCGYHENKEAADAGS